MLTRLIHHIFPDYQANFDLDDCDRILRIRSSGAEVQPFYVIHLLMAAGFTAEVLPETVETFAPMVPHIFNN